MFLQAYACIYSVITVYVSGTLPNIVALNQGAAIVENASAH